MTRAEFLLALCGAATISATLQAGDCDCPKTPGCSCSRQDDSGLLDHVDKVAGQFHSSFKKNFKLPIRITVRKSSDCEAAPSCGCEQKPSCGCEAAPSCGCEVAPSCGCEAEPTCGCEIGPSCGCEVCGSGSSSINESRSMPPSYAPIRQPSVMAPPSTSTPVPVPDTQVDPFADEAPRSGQSKVRGRTIQYRSQGQPVGQPIDHRKAYGQNYNSQARTLQPPRIKNDARGTQNLVTTASNESPTVEQVFKSAYRVKLTDTSEPTQTSGLRPVPSDWASGKIQNGSSSTSRTAAGRKIVAIEPLGQDEYERSSALELTPPENPLRR